MLGNLGITTALVALCKTESKNMKELIARVLNAVCNVQVEKICMSVCLAVFLSLYSISVCHYVFPVGFYIYHIIYISI